MLPQPMSTSLRCEDLEVCLMRVFLSEMVRFALAVSKLRQQLNMVSI